MSRTLLVLRHGKAEEPSPQDHARSLVERGRSAARRMGRFLTATDQVPELVLSSDAARALETAELAREAGGWHCPLQTDDRLYGAEPQALLEVLRELDDDAELVLLVGHEPGCSGLVSLLVGGGACVFATGAMARVELQDEPWSSLAPACGALRWLIDPKRLRASQNDVRGD